ncbi:MAG: amidotransferase [Desulfobulbus sp.]|nr:MAG: amidotransferase [Desulfobulbus sp.]RUM39807.1 MAG: amidotransferase [Desulfobulbus sp.]
MRVHYLQHVPFEGLGAIERFMQEKRHDVSCTRLFAGETLPAVDTFDWLIVMGGPMGIYDEDEYPWLAEEKVYIRSAIRAGKIVLGICLGAQLIADVLGAKVYFSGHREIGWFAITRSDGVENTALAGVFPEKAEVFHWHGDTFDIPEQAIPLAESVACKNQGFIFDDRVVALQFHLETTPDSARKLVENCRNELDGSAFVQAEDEIMKDPAGFIRLHSMLFSLLEALEHTAVT